MDFQLNLQSEMIEHLDPIPPLCVETGISARAVLRMLQQQRRSAVLVCRAGILIGLFTERDALRMIASGADLDVPVDAVMAREPVAVTPRDSVQEAIARMAHGGYRRLPVVDDQGRPVGVLSVRQILRYLVDHFPKTIYTLPPSPDSATRDREGA